MPETRGEVQYVGVGKPSFLERHTPRAHTEAIMQKYFWATDYLQGKPKEFAEALRPVIEKSAVAAGWTKTITELWLAGSALVAGVLAGKKLLTVSGVFGQMAERNKVPAGY